MTDSVLLTRFEDLERERSHVAELLAGVDDGVLNRRPDAGGWSAIQVVSHLVNAEERSLSYVRRKIEKVDEVGPPGWISKWRSGLIFFVLRSGKKVKAPPAVAEVPESCEGSAVLASWERVRGEWRATLDQVPAHWPKLALYRHPFAGPMNLEQCLVFCLEHVRHHRPQIERALTEAREHASRASTR